MDKVYILRVETEGNEDSFIVVFNKKPTDRDVSKYFDHLDDSHTYLTLFFEEDGVVLPDGTTIILEEHNVVNVIDDNVGGTSDNGNGVGLVIEYARDTNLILSEDEFEEFFSKLSEECQCYWKDEEAGCKFNLVNATSFLDFYKKGEFDCFDAKEKDLISRIYSLIVNSKPSYLKSGWVKFI